MGFIVNAQSFTKISKKISAYQLREGVRRPGKDRFNDVRLKLYELGKLSFINTAKEVFFLESYELENETFYGLVWDKNNKVNYSYHQGIFSYTDSLRYTKYMIKLVKNWEINSIRKEKQDNATMIPSSSVYATRVSKNGDGYIDINSVSFKEFFNLNRDR
ncbi:hypothetical protein GCM10027037_05040 [Mucilaginibacter koreensis]